MFSSKEPDVTGRDGPAPRRTLSIALRMALWYALSAFTLIAVATGALYSVLTNTMYQEDLRDLADNLNNARLLLHSSTPEQFAPSAQERPSWAPPHQPEIYLRVLDSNARTLTETPGMGEELPSPSSEDLARIGAPEGIQHDVLSRSGKPFMTLIVRVSGEGGRDPPQFMQVAMDREHDEYLLARYRERLWLVLGTSLVLCALAGYLIARSGMRPIQEISRAAARIRSTTLDERIQAHGLPAELAGLAGTFNSMLDRLEQSFLHISNFSDDVAHELRTPVNNLRGEIEVALSKHRSGEEYREILGSCLEECTRISRLIKTLLFLARADTTADTLERERIDVSQELTKVEEFYGAAAMDAGVVLRVRGAAGECAEVNRTLFQQAVGNLVSNAIAHTPPGGSVTVNARGDQSRLTVSVHDTGCGIPREHLPRVFDRFYRIDRARASSGQNVGLGLAVVKSIAARHGGHVEIDSEVGRGTEVRLVFPMLPPTEPIRAEEPFGHTNESVVSTRSVR
jgi:two-component system heavy metal sensor histidine kinase CusS